MKHRQFITVIGLVVLVGTAFYAGVLTERSGIEAQPLSIIDDAHAVPPSGTGTYTICDLHNAFAGLEEAFGYFADVIDGIRCSGIDCDRPFEAPENIVNDLNDITKIWGSGGRGMCGSEPCLEFASGLRGQFGDVLNQVPSLAPALDQVLKTLPEDEQIKFLSSAGGKPRGR